MASIKLNFIDIAKTTDDQDSINLLINMENWSIIETLLMNNSNITDEHIKLLCDITYSHSNNSKLHEILTNHNELIKKYPRFITSKRFLMYAAQQDLLQYVPDDLIIKAIQITGLEIFNSYYYTDAGFKSLIDRIRIDKFLDAIFTNIEAMSYSYFNIETLLDKLRLLSISLPEKHINYLKSLHDARVDVLLVEYNMSDTNTFDELVSQILDSNTTEDQLRVIIVKLSKLNLTYDQCKRLIDLDVQNKFYNCHECFTEYESMYLETSSNIIVQVLIDTYSDGSRNLEDEYRIYRYAYNLYNFSTSDQLKLLKSGIMDATKFNFNSSKCDETIDYIINHTDEFPANVIADYNTREYYNKRIPLSNLIENVSSEIINIYAFEHCIQNRQLTTEDIKLLYTFLNKITTNVYHYRKLDVDGIIDNYFEAFMSIYDESSIILIPLVTVRFIVKHKWFKFITVEKIQNYFNRHYTDYLKVLNEVASNEETPIEVLKYLRNNITGQGANSIKRAVKENPVFIENEKDTRVEEAKNEADSVRDIILEALQRGTIKQTDKDDLGIERDNASIKDIWKSLSTQDFISFKQQKYVELAKRSIN